jgi:hypothetical protein
MPNVRISPVAILLAAVAAFVVGFLWYSPLLFGNAWVAAHGFTPERMEAMRSTLGVTYGVLFVCLIVMGSVLSLLLNMAGVAGAVGGARIGFLGWLGFAATTGLTNNLFSDAPLRLFGIDSSYQMVYLTLMGAILGAWRARSAAIRPA